MLHINALTYRIEGRLLLEDATVAIPAGHKVGLVGRNGTGKSTLLRLIASAVQPDNGSISLPRNARIGQVAQEAPGGPDRLIDVVLAADRERTALLREAETARDAHRISEIQIRLADIDAHSAPARAATILAGLGFSETDQQRPCCDFSGGWRMRVALAAVLFSAPDILLLDEPTNYLDLEGTLWLQNFLKTFPATVIIVSHDRDLLNAVPQAILHLDRHRLTLWSGNYDRFERLRAEEQARQLKLKKRQDEQRRHIKSFVDRFRAKATKARQAQSRLKMLEKMETITTYVDTDVAPFHFPSPKRRLNPPLIRLEDGAVGYVPHAPVLRRLNLRIDPDDRIALLGSNGNGKTTIARLLCGRLPLESGTMRHHKRMEAGYFSQHQIEELRSDATPYQYMLDLMPDATIALRRARLGAFGIGAALADNKVATLSGGECSRLALMLATFAGPDLLILDEPTNHLDIDSRSALISALNEYEGAVILISHDRHLIEACAERLWLVGDGTVAPFDGDLDDYTRLVLERARAERRQERGAAAGRAATGGNRETRQSAQDRRRMAAKAREQLQPLRQELKTIEARMEALRKTIAGIETQMADPTLYEGDGERVAGLAAEAGNLRKEIERLEDAWLETSETLEQATRGVAAE